MQVDSLNELPEEKRPPDSILWDGKPEDITKWIKNVFKVNNPKNNKIFIREDEIEG